MWEMEMPFTHGWSHEWTINNYQKCAILYVKSESEPFVWTSVYLYCWAVTQGQRGLGHHEWPSLAKEAAVSSCFLNDCNIWPLQFDGLFRELVLFATFSSFVKEA